MKNKDMLIALFTERYKLYNIFSASNMDIYIIFKHLWLQSSLFLPS